MAAVSTIDTPSTDELRAFHERIERTSRGLGVLNIFKVMAHTPELMQSWWAMMALLFTRLELEPRLRELVELTFCIANWNLMAHLLLPLEIELEPAAREYLPATW